MSSLSTPPRTGVPCPRASASLFSRLTFAWVSPALRHKDAITPQQFYDLEDHNTSETLSSNLARQWAAETRAKGSRAALWRAFLKAFGWRYAALGLYPLSQTVLRAAQTVFLGLLVGYFNDDSVTTGAGWAYGAGVVGMGLLNLLVHHQFFYRAWEAGTRMRAAAMSLIMQKALDVRLDALAGTTAGYVLNLASSDVERFLRFGIFSHYIWVAVVEGLVVLGLMYAQVGVSAFIGYGFFLLLIPLQVLFSRLFGRLRQQTAALTDERVRVTSQVLNGIRIIKMFAWEAPFAKKVVDIRNKEITKVLRASIMRAVNDSIFTAAPLLFSVATFLPYWALGNTLTPAKVFTVTSLFWMAQLTVAKFFPMCFELFAEARIAFRRIQAFLQLPDCGSGWLGGPEMGEEAIEQGAEQNEKGKQKASRHKQQRTGVLLQGNKQVQARAGATAAAAKEADTRKSGVNVAEGEGEGSAAGLTEQKASFSAHTNPIAAVSGDDIELTERRQPAGPSQHESEDDHIATDDSDASDHGGDHENHYDDTHDDDQVITVSHAEYSWGVVRDEAVAVAIAEAKDAHGKGKKGKKSSKGQSGAIRIEDEVREKSLDDVTFACTRGTLTTIAGPVGSGKTTLLLALLKELPLDIGTIAVRGAVAYVPQQPWIVTGTVRENILFGQAMDAVWYSQVVEACCLEADLQALQHGDETLIGERGINLSGGQKARIGLARACYRRPDIILLDDPLSAVDAKVSRALFQQCIQGLLRHATRVLVTHQLQFLHAADQIVVMERGHSVLVGSFATVRTSPQLTSILAKLHAADEDASGGGGGGAASGADSALETASLPFAASVASLWEELDAEEACGMGIGAGSAAEGPAYRRRFSSVGDSVGGSPVPDAEEATSTRGGGEAKETDTQDKGDTKDKEGVILQEGKAEGTVSYKTYLKFWTEAGGYFVVVLLALLLAGAQATFNFAIYWISLWSNEDPAEQDKSFYYQWYIGLSVAAVVLILVRTVAFYIATLKASQSLHDKMLRRVIQTFVSFFDANPSGRILNRFGKDMSYLDDLLPQTFFDFAMLVAVVCATIIIVCIVNPWVLLATVPLMIAFFILRRYYLRSAREVKRLEALSRSPVYSLLAEVLQGLPALRSLHGQRRVRAAFHAAMNANTRGFHMFMLLSRWLGWRLDFLVLLFVSATVVFGLAVGRSLDAALVGMAVSYTLQLSGAFQWMVRQSAEVENQMVSAERCFEYAALPKEEVHLNETLQASRRCCGYAQHLVPFAATAAGKRSAAAVPPAWPSAGEIEFRNVWMRYRPGLEPVLKGLNVRIPAGAKVGIVGRTGAGKSSCIAALYRLVEPLRATPAPYKVLEDDEEVAAARSSGSDDDGNSGVWIDDIRTFNVPLPRLRSAMSIIPQDPWLSNGTVRYNLDPFDEHTDEEILESLRQVQLHEAVLEKGGLLAKVSEGGSNFSVGQRQLLCLARAMLRKTKILIMDEPTANVDLETDSTIHHAIHNSQAFQHSTVITIAHRLATIIAVDLVLVLSHGRLVEAGHPHELLSAAGSAFSDFVAETGAAASTALRDQAEAAWRSKHSSASAALLATHD